MPPPPPSFPANTPVVAYSCFFLLAGRPCTPAPVWPASQPLLPNPLGAHMTHHCPPLSQSGCNTCSQWFESVQCTWQCASVDNLPTQSKAAAAFMSAGACSCLPAAAAGLADPGSLVLLPCLDDACKPVTRWRSGGIGPAKSHPPALATPVGTAGAGTLELNPNPNQGVVASLGRPSEPSAGRSAPPFRHPPF